MVQAIINIKKRTNHVLNIIKAKFDLKDKSQAIDMMAKEYEESILEPELRPEFVEKIKKIEKNNKFSHYDSLEVLHQEIENA
jgi:hypothetical protein